MVDVVSSETHVILSSLVLVGCHVFDAVDIVCAGNEPCAHPHHGDTDTDVDADTDTDTDIDTGPVVAPLRGWVISLQGTPNDRVGVYGPHGETVAAWTDLGDSSGPVAYDPTTQTGVLASGRQLFLLGADGTTTAASPTFPDTAAVAFDGATAYAVDGANLLTWSVADDTSTEAFSTALSGLVAVALGPSGSVYASDTDGGSPDLYQWFPGDSPVPLYADFDVSAARARVLFTGPADEAYACSAAGAFYRIADLASGSSTPVVFYAGGLTDVSACAYDPGDETWLLFSPSAGVIRVDAQGRGDVVFEPPASYTLVRANFF
jgi:hypothetical protein